MKKKTFITILLALVAFTANAQLLFRISGNGLGLTQAKAIVDYYGGTIYAKSGAGKGMAIYIQLPAESK